MPTKQYGNYVVLNEPNPDKLMILEAKKLLCESIRRAQEQFDRKAKHIKFKICKNYELYDPETGETVICSTVGWVATI